MMMDHMYQGVLDALENYLVVVDEAGKILFTNKAWGELTQQLGVSGELDWREKNYFDCSAVLQLDHTEFTKQCKRNVELLAQNLQQEFVIECSASTLENKVWLKVTGSIIHIEQRQYYLLNHCNIIDHKASLEKIDRLTLEDAVTGLANRTKFNTFYFNEWQRSMRSKSEISLLFGQIDNQSVDDEQRCIIADIFTRHARRACDLAALIQPNKFALVLGQMGSNACESVAQSIYEEVESLHMSCPIGRQITMNFGVSSATPTLIDTSDMLLNTVDRALCKSQQSQQERITSLLPTIKFNEPLIIKRH